MTVGNSEDYLVDLLREFNRIPAPEKRTLHLKRSIERFRENQNQKLSEEELEQVTAAGSIDLRLCGKLTDAVIERQDVLRHLRVAHMQGDLALINKLKAQLNQLELEIEGMESGSL